VNVLKKINDGLMAFIKIVLIFAGTLMTCLVIMNVILRYVFNSGLSWSEESCRFLFIWVTFLGAILANDAGLHGEHMRMDFIVEMFHGIPRKIVEVIALLLVLAMLGVLFVGGIELVQGTWPMLTSALRIPKGAVYLCAPIGFGYMFIQTLVKLYKAITYSDEKLENADKEAE
jgi:TRAP-type C4-dicarboxylate transport system permease small subunit